MAISNGMTNCESERIITADGFEDLLIVVLNSKKENEVHIKSALYDIISNSYDSDEEKEAQKIPYIEALNNQEESDIRIRRAILTGLFSFWEISLKELCRYFKIHVTKNGNKSPRKDTTKSSNKKTNDRFISADYVASIYEQNIPYNVKLIDTSIRALRNYFTHGSADEQRRNIIGTLSSNHPEYGIVVGDQIYLSSYDGLYNIKNLIVSTLDDTEKFMRGMNQAND